jgi:hypothetical protein
MNLRPVVDAYKKANNSVWTEWVFRLFFSMTFIYTVLMTWKSGETFYPDDCFLLIFIAIWFYFFKIRLLGFIPIIFCALYHYWHYS